jgi:catechol 2,3-dioxygenase-like lactoylglutathione lyase family enzyme
MDWKLELPAVPVSDVDRAKDFYTEQVGFNADHDHRVSEEIRFVQLTPPGSACSIAIGTGLTDAAPGSARGLQLVVGDIDAARVALAETGVPDVSDVQVFPWGSFVFFSDPAMELAERRFGHIRQRRQPLDAADDAAVPRKRQNSHRLELRELSDSSV